MNDSPNSVSAWQPQRLSPELLMRGGDPALVGKELLHIIDQAMRDHPRQVQARIGPSEIGNPCARRLGYKLLLTPTFNIGSTVSWKAWVGTAVHEKLQWVFDQFNLSFGQDVAPGDERFYMETRVPAGFIGPETIDGSCDLYDRMTCGVIDWKCVGPTQLKKYKAQLKIGKPVQEAGWQYQTQAHAYGAGWKRIGLPVDYVMIVFLPRNGELSDTHVWYEPFDERIAVAGFQRAEGIKLTVDTLGTRGLDLLPIAEAYCFRCPYFLRDSKDLSKGCPGFPTEQALPKPPLKLEGKPT